MIVKFDDIIKLPKRPKLLAPDTMAYIGDCVFELFIRTALLEKTPNKPGQLHQDAIGYVNAGAQASLLEKIRPNLSESEASIVRRGRNVKTNVPRNVDASDYQYSTGFEALLGYLYLAKEEDRLEELFKLIKETLFVEEN